ncbi:MAG: tripartite tricarboxylate transporter substrate-binding protein, partial [Comamonas sp.]
MTNSLRRSWLAAGALAVLPMMAWAQPQSWPARPVRVVVSYPAGGVSDVVARALGDKLTAQLGQPIVVENKAGAGGSIGLDQVAKAQPDGYTLGFSAISPLALSPHLGKLPFDPAKDLIPVASVMYSPVLLLATKRSTAKDFGQLIDQAKK